MCTCQKESSCDVLCGSGGTSPKLNAQNNLFSLTARWAIQLIYVCRAHVDAPRVPQRTQNAKPVRRNVDGSVASLTSGRFSLPATRISPASVDGGGGAGPDIGICVRRVPFTLCGSWSFKESDGSQAPPLLWSQLPPSDTVPSRP